MKREYLLLCLACGLLFSCGEGGSQVEEERSLPVVTVDVASRRDVDQTGTFTGTIEAQVSNNIAPQSPVRIGRIYVEVGDRVKKGQRLVETDGANLAQAKVRMENDKVEFERADELYRIGGTSKSEWEARKLAYDVSKTNYDNLNENTMLLSPISGVVTARNYDNGDMYSGAAPILTVEQIRPVKLKVDVSEVLFTKVKKGMEVEVATDVYGDRIFKGHINIVYPTVDPATRTFPIEVRIDNADEAVRPGMFARVSLAHETADRVVIPDR
ncbi:MAG: efflux RND transporter periplasmic adaptor subunit, partial [Rikenellaceae bacterium]|nr:efflux RND transporter periplasmic adaptor subunit [Rikenellaceae bacterium]